MTIIAALTLVLTLPSNTELHPIQELTSLASLEAEIIAMKAPKVAWRNIAWKSCLLDGLKESQETKKPVLLWIFIDRPIDDARC